MTEPTLAAGPANALSTDAAELKVMFINWPVDGAGLPACGLLDGKDFSDCSIAFFDPLEFAYAYGFLVRGDDITETSYRSLDQNAFMRYLRLIKGASEKLRRFLDRGGILVIRSNVPKAHIRVRKQSAAGTMKYTESVISAYFWMQDLLGNHSFTYCQARGLKYLIPGHPLHGVFGRSPVECVQTLNSVDSARLEVIATSGSSAGTAAISRITFDAGSGQVFLIPKFVIDDEPSRLVEAFDRIARSYRTRTVLPHWMAYYRKQLMDFSPYRAALEDVRLQLDALTKQLTLLEDKQDRYDGLGGLLYESDEELETAARTALEIMGYECGRRSTDGTARMFEAHARGDISESLVVRVAGTESGPIPSGEADRLADAIGARLSSAGVKGLLIGNASRTGRPDQRPVWFDDDCIAAGHKHNICLMPSLVLFTTACYIMARTNAENLDNLTFSLRRDILACDSVFVLSRRKYAI